MSVRNQGNDDIDEDDDAYTFNSGTATLRASNVQSKGDPTLDVINDSSSSVSHKREGTHDAI
jgi:hypothetical protein